eukprot:364354-Chlamydomonas_euryale.AAC.6
MLLQPETHRISVQQHAPIRGTGEVCTLHHRMTDHPAKASGTATAATWQTIGLQRRPHSPHAERSSRSTSSRASACSDHSVRTSSRSDSAMSCCCMSASSAAGTSKSISTSICAQAAPRAKAVGDGAAGSTRVVAGYK